jgi:sporulation protein YlmC with PRC-barrel domain
MPAIKVDEISKFIGSEVFDDFGRSLGTLIAVESDIDGKVSSIIVKSEDLSLDVIEGERVKVSDDKVTVTPEWKFEILQVIENLDRAYKRRKAIENISSRNDLPAVVIEPMKRKLEDEIKALKLKADEVKKVVNSRIGEIDDESLKVARAIATIGISYFSGEISERSYTQSMNHLRKLQDSLGEEKKAAKDLLDKLDKVVQLASEGEVQKAVQPQPSTTTPSPVATGPNAQQTMVVKIEA